MKTILLTIHFFIFSLASGQIQYLETITTTDVSNLWTLDSFQIENDTIIVERPEPIGYFGDNYQRFSIHFISVIKDPGNSLIYHVYGKTRVKSNICSFQGTINIIGSELFAEGDFPPLKQGWLKGNYQFYEDPDDKGSGILSGQFQSYYYLDEKDNFKYDGLMFGSDGFENNQFEGTWKKYKTNEIKKCNWGDYRIPDSKALDIGAAEFGPIDKYDEYGWKDFDLWRKEAKWWKE